LWGKPLEVSWHLSERLNLAAGWLAFARLWPSYSDTKKNYNAEGRSMLRCDFLITAKFVRLVLPAWLVPKVTRSVATCLNATPAAEPDRFSDRAGEP
jgi:hypothetical protein